MFTIRSLFSSKIKKINLSEVEPATEIVKKIFNGGDVLWIDFERGSYN